MPFGLPALAFAVISTLQNPALTPPESIPADRHTTAPAVRAARVQGDIAVDGRLHEASWAAAEPAIRFIQTEPAEGMPASERTEVRVLIDADALYVGARLHDREPKRIKAALARRDDDVGRPRRGPGCGRAPDRRGGAERGGGEGELLVELVGRLSS